MFCGEVERNGIAGSDSMMGVVKVEEVLEGAEG
jgi:hypothetical protein